MTKGSYFIKTKWYVKTMKWLRYQFLLRREMACQKYSQKTKWLKDLFLLRRIGMLKKTKWLRDIFLLRLNGMLKKESYGKTFLK